MTEAQITVKWLEEGDCFYDDEEIQKKHMSEEEYFIWVIYQASQLEGAYYSTYPNLNALNKCVKIEEMHDGDDILENIECLKADGYEGPIVLCCSGMSHSVIPICDYSILEWAEETLGHRFIYFNKDGELK